MFFLFLKKQNNVVAKTNTTAITINRTVEPPAMGPTGIEAKEIYYNNKQFNGIQDAAIGVGWFVGATDDTVIIVALYEEITAAVLLQCKFG